jgi:predicted nucleic acid-binding protein
VVLADTGPIVAYLNGRDTHHAWSVSVFKELKPPLLTCEAVLSEAAFLLQSTGAAIECSISSPEACSTSRSTCEPRRLP